MFFCRNDVKNRFRIKTIRRCGKK